MKHFLIGLRLLLDDQTGQGLVEYGMIVTLIAVALLSLVSLLFGPAAAYLDGWIKTLQAYMVH